MAEPDSQKSDNAKLNHAIPTRRDRVAPLRGPAPSRRLSRRAHLAPGGAGRAGEIDDEPGPMAKLGVDRDSTTVTFHDHLHHVEAEAHPGDRFHRGGALERLEDLLRHPRIDAGAAVDDLEVRRVGRAIVAEAHLDRLA